MDKAISKFSSYLTNYNKPGKTMLHIRFRASNKAYSLSRSTVKVYVFVSYLTSVILILYIVFGQINKYINEFELKKRLTFGLFKNFEINTRMMCQLKIVKEKFNEIDCKTIPDITESMLLF